MRSILALLALAGATTAGAQSGPSIVNPGMSRSQVLEVLGPPAAERVAGSFVYLFYQNGCERECGMSDLVTLEDGAVVDAIFRSSLRRYSGASSSPTGIQAQHTATPRADALVIGSGAASTVAPAPAQVGGVRVESEIPSLMPVAPPVDTARPPVMGADALILRPVRDTSASPPADTLRGPPPEE